MAARTEQFLLNNVFQDGQPPGSITASDMRDFVESSKYLSAIGWKFYLDNQYTQAARRTITAGNRTQVTINGLAETSGHPPGSPECWNPTTNRVIPFALNGFGILRFAFRGTSVSTQPSRVEVEFDVGGGAGVIFEETVVFSRGANVTQAFNLIMPFFCGPDFINNGGAIYITPEATGTFWEFGLTALNVYVPNPAL